MQQTNWDDTPDEGEGFQDILSSLFTMQSGGRRRRTVGLAGISLNSINLFLGGRSIPIDAIRGRSYVDDEEFDEDDDNEDDEETTYTSQYHRRAQQWFPSVTEPVEAGVELLNGGEFGRLGVKMRTRSRNQKNIARSILDRKYLHTAPMSREDITSNLIPNTDGTTVAYYDSNIYTAQFSEDSSLYYTCAQDFRLHIFDSNATRDLSFDSEPSDRRSSSNHLRARMTAKKTIQGCPGRWTITDANLSPDSERIIYSSITPTVYMTSTSPDGSHTQIPIPFADSQRTRRPRHFFDNDDSFGIWSCRFSADGNEIIAGGNSKIFVYDLIANRRSVKISAHKDDVNSCCWADTASGNVLVSASDDTFLKVWDRRSLGGSQKPSGVLIGHTEGITYVSAKGDGRYVISNGKDQAMRLWDLRKMRSSADFEAVADKRYGLGNFDYRYPHYPRPRYLAHPQDCSVMTYRGHSVLRTLIRCHFSPAETTGSQYLYSGSADGKIHIWSLDGRIVQILDRANTHPGPTFDPSSPESDLRDHPNGNGCVRDVSWHPQEPVIMSAAWVTGHDGSIIARHEWKGLSKVPGCLEDWVEKNGLEQTELQSEMRRSSSSIQRATTTPAYQHVPGAYLGVAGDGDDDDESRI